MGLQARIDKRRKQTANSRHGGPRFPSLVSGKPARHPDEDLVAGSTSVVLGRCFVYLAVVMKVFTCGI